MYKNDGYVRRYSESFKLKILDELAKGNHSKRQIGLTYGVQSSTINQWIKKYDRKDLMKSTDSLPILMQKLNLSNKPDLKIIWAIYQRNKKWR